jgi:hypothetical protein
VKINYWPFPTAPPACGVSTIFRSGFSLTASASWADVVVDRHLHAVHYQPPPASESAGPAEAPDGVTWSVQFVGFQDLRVCFQDLRVYCLDRRVKSRRGAGLWDERWRHHPPAAACRGLQGQSVGVPGLPAIPWSSVRGSPKRSCCPSPQSDRSGPRESIASIRRRSGRKTNEKMREPGPASAPSTFHQVTNQSALCPTVCPLVQSHQRANFRRRDQPSLTERT